jgi:hypothetical protein
VLIGVWLSISVKYGIGTHDRLFFLKGLLVDSMGYHKGVGIIVKGVHYYSNYGNGNSNLGVLL